MNEHIRIVIVDDHLVVREGLRFMLETGDGLELVGDASDGATALALVRERQPDVVLMDLRMPGMDGLEAIAHIKAEWPQIAVVILTTYNEDELMIRGLQAGACGYLLKDCSLETLFAAIRVAARGEMLIQPEIMARILAYSTSASATAATTREQWNVTEREHEVLALVAQGYRNKEIAARLHITERTVRAHLSNIYTKLNVDSRISAVTVALEQGLLSQKF